MSNIKHPRAKTERGVRVKSKADKWTDVTDNNISDLFKKMRIVISLRLYNYVPLPGTDPEGEKGVQTPPPLEKQLDPLGPIASRGRFVRPYLKTKTTTKQQRKNNNARTPHPLMEFSGSIHAHNIYLDGKQ